ASPSPTTPGRHPGGRALEPGELARADGGQRHEEADAVARSPVRRAGSRTSATPRSRASARAMQPGRLTGIAGQLGSSSSRRSRCAEVLEEEDRFDTMAPRWEYPVTRRRHGTFPLTHRKEASDQR